MAILSRSKQRTMLKMQQKSVAGLLCLALAAHAYVPASPSNELAAGVGVTNDIQINWLPMGQVSYRNGLTRVLVNNADGKSIAGYRGAMVRFDERNATEATGTPWIALISCDGTEEDTNGPVFPSASDAVSLALQAGAETAVLYSLTAVSCALDPNFVSSYNGSLDLYVAQQNTPRAILGQYVNVLADAEWFNQTALQDSYNAVNWQISSMGGMPSTSTVPSLFGSTGVSSGATPSSTSSAIPTPTPSPGARFNNYLIATIANAGANGGTVSTQQQGGGGGGPNTGLAMIILYAITGCVTLLFLVVILSGAIRALRHPERYGPRGPGGAGGSGSGGQSRAQGLTQAILDTFPVVKYLSGQGGQRGAQDAQAANKLDDEESGTGANGGTRTVAGSDANTDGVRMHVLASPTTTTTAHGQEASAATLATVPHLAHGRHGTDATLATTPGLDSDDKDVDAAPGRGSTDTGGAAATVEGMDPADVNDSVTCPICLLDFEDGDDLRILPCDARHRFHDECVVPWLLNVSSLCPLCRLDLSKERDPATSNAEGSEDTAAASGVAATGSTGRPRPRASSVLRAPRRLLGSGPSESTSAAASDAAQGQAPTRSRFMRYVRETRAQRGHGHGHGDLAAAASAAAQAANADAPAATSPTPAPRSARATLSAIGRAMPGIGSGPTWTDPSMQTAQQQHTNQHLSPSGIPLSNVRP